MREESLNCPESDGEKRRIKMKGLGARAQIRDTSTALSWRRSSQPGATCCVSARSEGCDSPFGLFEIVQVPGLGGFGLTPSLL
jgi:hypothetical protein